MPLVGFEAATDVSLRPPSRDGSSTITPCIGWWSSEQVRAKPLNRASSRPPTSLLDAPGATSLGETGRPEWRTIRVERLVTRS
jgi:hypothetical protein